MFNAIKTFFFTGLLAISALVLTISLPILTIAFTAVVVVVGSYFTVKLFMYDDEEEGEQ